MKKGDIILLISLLLIGIAGILVVMLLGKTPQQVIVTVDGQVYGRYSPVENREIVIQTENGGENVLVIYEGTAYVASANCPNLDCVNHKPISLANESIVCLPHKVVITISDGDIKDSADAFVY